MLIRRPRIFHLWSYYSVDSHYPLHPAIGEERSVELAHPSFLTFVRDMAHSPSTLFCPLELSDMLTPNRKKA